MKIGGSRDHVFLPLEGGGQVGDDRKNSFFEVEDYLREFNNAGPRSRNPKRNAWAR
jgi:hypothetical protein